MLQRVAAEVVGEGEVEVLGREQEGDWWVVRGEGGSCVDHTASLLH